MFSLSSSPSAIFWEYSYDKLRFRLDIIYGVMPRPKRKEKLVKVCENLSTLCGKARRTSQDVATT